MSGDVVIPYGTGSGYWREQRRRRTEASIGTVIYFGRCNFGRDHLFMPVIRRTKTRLVCSNGERTDSVMIESGHIVGRLGARMALIGDDA